MKKFLVIALTGTITLTSTITSAFAKTSDEIRQEIDEYEEDLNSAQETEKDLESQIEEVTNNIADLTSETKDLALEVEEYKDGMNTRIQYFYERDDSSILNAIFGAGSFAEMLNKLEYQKSLYDYDAEQLEEYKECKEALTEKENELSDNEKELESLLEEQEELEAELKDTISDKETEYEETKAEEERIAEEKRKAEEEARRQAEAEAAAQQAVIAGTTATTTTTTSAGQNASGQSSSEQTNYGTLSYTSDYAGMSKDDIEWDVACKIYSVLKYIGWNDYQIAGALGNINAECSFDFTSVEWVSWHCNESYTWGPTKQATADKDYIMSAINPNYSFSKVYRTGIGLIQWTDTTNGATGNTRLREYAAAHGHNWYELDIQLMFLTDYNGDSARADYIRNWTKYQKYSVNDLYDACSWWSYYIEGCFYDTAKRQSMAQSWYNSLSYMTYDEAYAERILSGNID